MTLVAVSLALSLTPVEAQEDSELTLPGIFNKTENSVVQITSARAASDSLIQRGEQNPRDDVALGSGFVYDLEGHIITNYHVVSDPNDIDVTFIDGDSFPARVIGKDPYSDIAVLQIADDGIEKNVSPLVVANSSTLKVGEQVIAIGNPFGLSGTLTSGVVSQMGRVLPNDVTGFSIANVIQTDAAINPGNSGGPLLNTKGEVVGMNTAIFSNTGLYSGVGFAIPSNMVQKVVSSLLSNGFYDHPYIGISGITVSPEIQNATNGTKGILVVDISMDSPADKAGLRGGDKLAMVDGNDIRLGGDIIVAVDNQTVRAMDDLLSYLEEKKSVGDHIDLSIIRDGKPQQISLVLSARLDIRGDDEIQANLEQQREQRPTLGINGINVTPEIAERMNLSETQKGFLVEEILFGGPADIAGIRGGYRAVDINGSEVKLGGDIIVGIGGVEVNNVRNIQSFLETTSVGDQVQIEVIRGDQRITIPLTLGEPMSNQPLEQPPQLPYPREMPFDNPLGDIYDQCVNAAGKDLCDQLFGR